MPPKNAQKNQVSNAGGKKGVVVSGGSGGENGPGKQTGGVVPPNAGLEFGGNDGTQSGGSKNGLPPSAGHGTTPGQPRSTSTSPAGGTPMEVDLVNASIREKVSHWAKETEKACYAYGDELMQATQEAVEKVKGIDAQSAKAMTSSWSAARKKVQPRLNQCLLQLVESVPQDLDVVAMKESVHPGVRAVAFRDIVENARTDIVGSLEDLVKWVVGNMHDPATIQSMAFLKQDAYTQIYDTALTKLSREIYERMADTGSTQVDFGRDSDYDQALEAQQVLAKDGDDLQLQLDGFQKQVDHLKASEADLYARCTELQDKFAKAQKDLLASRDSVGILEAVTDFLETDEANVVGGLVRIKEEHIKNLGTIRQLEEKDDSARVANLEAQLRVAKDANVNLQRIVADQAKNIPSGSGGAQQSLVERARDIGFVVGSSGNLQLGPPRQAFDIAQPYFYASRNQSVPAPPPFKVFLGEFKEDQMGLCEFLRMYKHRYGPCAEDTKVDMLGEYLAGEAKRVYRSILSSWEGKYRITFDKLESQMKNLMLDNSRTGMLLKQQRVHGLRMNDNESYLSFITFLEPKVSEAYDDESYSIVDNVKIQVLLRNIRDPTLALQVEQALRNVPMGSPLFPTAKDLVLAYERTAKHARQWNNSAGSGSNRNNGKGSGRGKFQGNSSSQEKSEAKSTGADGAAATPAGSNTSSGSPRNNEGCFHCHTSWVIGKLIVLG